MASCVGANLPDGLKPRCSRRVLSHGTNGRSLRGSLTRFILLQDERRKADLKLLHDLALRDGLQAGLEAQLWSMRAVGTLAGRLGADVRLCRLGWDWEDCRLDEVRSLGG